MSTLAFGETHSPMFASETKSRLKPQAARRRNGRRRQQLLTICGRLRRPCSSYVSASSPKQVQRQKLSAPASDESTDDACGELPESGESTPGSCAGIDLRGAILTADVDLQSNQSLIAADGTSAKRTPSVSTLVVDAADVTESFASATVDTPCVSLDFTTESSAPASLDTRSASFTNAMVSKTFVALLSKAKESLFPEPVGQVVEVTPEMTVRRTVAVGTDGVATPMVSLTFPLPDVPADFAYNFLRDKANSVSWHQDVDSVHDLTSCVEGFSGSNNAVGRGTPGTGGDSLHIWKTLYKIPAFARYLGFEPREVSEYRCCVASDALAYIIAATSVDAACTEVKTTVGYKSAHLNLGAYAFVPLQGGGCEMRAVSHVNPGGVPTWLLERVATKKPKEFCTSFAQAVRAAHQQHLQSAPQLLSCTEL